MLKLSIVGAGKVGSVLGRQLVRHQVFQMAQVLNRSASSAQAAIARIGEGQAVSDLAQMVPADMLMLALPDDQIASVCEQMAARGLFQPGMVVFHCSGAKSSLELHAASAAGAAVASVHPVRSFADPLQVADSFDGTICSVEGDAAALQILVPALQAIRASVVQISADNKLLYHAGSVFASNYLVSLMETALQTYQAAGIPHAMAIAMAEPLARQSLDNVFKLGTAVALTGPIARGDMATVARQQQAVREWDSVAGDLYAAFAPPTVALASQKKTL